MVSMAHAERRPDSQSGTTCRPYINGSQVARTDILHVYRLSWSASDNDGRMIDVMKKQHAGTVSHIGDAQLHPRSTTDPSLHVPVIVIRRAGAGRARIGKPTDRHGSPEGYLESHLNYRPYLLP